MKVIRRQVRRPARPFQVEISSVSFLDVISAKSLQIGIDLMYLLLGDRRQVRRQTRPLQVEISLQKGFLALISEVLIDGNKLVIAALSQIDVEIWLSEPFGCFIARRARNFGWTRRRPARLFKQCMSA